MRHKLTISLLVLGLVVVVLAETDKDGGAIQELVERILKEFNKARAQADADYEKKISPTIKRHNLKRVSQIHTAGTKALRDLRDIAADARKNNSPVGEALAKDGMTYVDKIMGESEKPIPVREMWRVSFNKHHYLAVLAPVTWEQAGAVCKKMGGHLVYIEDDEEMQFVQKLTGGTLVYVGATDKQKEGDWRWLNGRKVSRSFWAPQRPLKNNRVLSVAVLFQNGLLDSTPTSSGARGFICEWDK